MKPILPKGAFSFKIPDVSKSIKRILPPPGSTILIIPHAINNSALDSCSLSTSQKELGLKSNFLSANATKNRTVCINEKITNIKHIPTSSFPITIDKAKIGTLNKMKYLKKGRSKRLGKIKNKVKKTISTLKESKKEVRNQLFLIETKAKMIGYPFQTRPNYHSSSDNSSLIGNDITTMERDKLLRCETSFLKELGLTQGDYFPKTNEMVPINYNKNSSDFFPTKLKESNQDETSFDRIKRSEDAEFTAEKNNCRPSHGIESMRTENPPSYEAHFCNSPPQYNGTTSPHFSSPFIATAKIPQSLQELENKNTSFPPPYYQSPENNNHQYNMQSPNCDDSSNQSYLQNSTSPQIEYFGNEQLINSDSSKYNYVNREVHTTENVSKEYYNSNNSENCNYLKSYDEEPKDYSNYSENCISQLKRKETDTLQYIRTSTFNDNALTVIGQSNIENEAYQRRQKHASSILNNINNQVTLKQTLKENFWIVEDEPLIVNNSSSLDSSEDLSNKVTPVFKKIKSVNKQYVCHICGKVLTGRNSFASHLNRHLKGKSYQCQFCVRKFSQICSLKYHTRIHTGENPYTCQICSKSFKALSNLNKHSMVHSHQRLYKCTICDKAFKTKYNQQMHIKRHFSQSNTCKICHSSFESRKALATHIQRKHKNDKLYPCQDCGKSYQYLCLLNQHLKAHTNERCHSCHLCGASFVWKSGLSSHLKTHSFKLQCEICPCKFTSLKKLDKHRRQHADPLPHKCIKCKKEFKYAYLLKNHLTRHKEDLLCNICNLGFITKVKLKKHLKIHSEPPVP